MLAFLKLVPKNIAASNTLFEELERWESILNHM